MYEYKTELLETSVKWGFKDSASKKDLKVLDEFIQAKIDDGWELVTYSYMANTFATRSAFAITFKRKKK